MLVGPVYAVPGAGALFLPLALEEERLKVPWVVLRMKGLTN